MSPPSLPAAVSGERHSLDTATAGRVSYYVAGANNEEPPLLLIHSMNAAASAHEIRPLYEHYARQRRVIGPDMPGFGFSERSKREYSPRIMTDAIHAVMTDVRAKYGDEPIDALAVSLSCEFLARAASEAPDRFRSVALVSPTALNRSSLPDGPPESTRGIGWLYRTLTLPGVGEGLFGLLTTKRSVRYFLKRTFGSKEVDDALCEYSWLTANQPDAQHAPFRFLSGYLFSNDVGRLYQSLDMPVWMSHGVRGDFTDYRRKADLAVKPNWEIDVFETGALPYFEEKGKFIERLDEFLADAVEVIEQ